MNNGNLKRTPKTILPYLWPDQNFDDLLMTVDTVALNISYKGLFLTVLLQ